MKTLEIVKQTRTVKGTWCNGEGEVYQLQFNKSMYGLRIAVHNWITIGQIEVRLIKGNGRQWNFKEYKKIVVTTQEGVQQAIEELKELAITL
ncbi:hypothetical protein ACQ3VF_26185 [Bacillus toyonensis]|uniref:hypothetical protein n=1 Tax=Bacillus toyonensis TaxID=155322 RepID=UPI003D302F50